MKKLERYLDLTIGLLYILFTTLEYLPAFSQTYAYRLGDWCFVTGIIGGGLFFLVSAILQFFDKEIPNFLHLYNTVLLSVILIGTLVLSLQLSGYLWFLHVVGPLLVLFRFFTFCDCRNIEVDGSVIVLGVFPAVYVTLSYVMMKVLGKCSYPVSMLFYTRNLLFGLGAIVVFIMGIIGLGFLLLFLNRVTFNTRTRE